LEHQGLVRRVASSTDRRVTHIALTRKGLTRFEQLGPVMAVRLEEIFSVLSVPERETSSAYLRQLRDRAADRLHRSRQVFEEAERDMGFAPRTSTRGVAAGELKSSGALPPRG